VLYWWTGGGDINSLKMRVFWNKNADITIFQVGSKIDRTGSRAVRREEGEALAKKYGATFYESSSKTRENIREPFITTVDRIVETPHLMDPALMGKRDGTVALGHSRNEPEVVETGCAC
jgi:hypothetical protein